MSLVVLVLMLVLPLLLPLRLLHGHQDVTRATLSHHLHHLTALQSLREGRLRLLRLGATWPKLQLTLAPLLHLNLNLLHLLRDRGLLANNLDNVCCRRLLPR